MKEGLSIEMSNSILEVKLTQYGSAAVIRGDNVVFDEQLSYPVGIEYDNTTGIIKFNELGQYSIKWWVATETTLKGTIGFQLQSLQGGFVPASGCSPIKTGQVSGFGAIDVDTVGTTLSLVNASTTKIIISRKAEIKGYLLIMPISPSSTRVYRGNLSTAGSSIQVPLGNGLYYRLEHASPTEARLVLTPMNGTTLYDYRRFCSYNGIIAVEGDYSDNATLSGSVTKDPAIYNRSQEMHWVLIRVQNPVSKLWSTYEVRFFMSGGVSRVTVWVNVIEEEVSY